MASFQSAAFTLCAEAFSVVGLADVVFRQVAVLSDLAKRAANAITTARSLLLDLKSLASAIGATRNWAENYETSDFAIQDSQNVSDSVKAILIDCGKHLEDIQRALHRVASSSGVLAKLWTGVQFAREEHDLRQSIISLSTYTDALLLLMQSHSGNDMVLLRRGQRTMAESMAQNQSVLVKRLDIAQEVSRSQQEASRGYHTTTIARLNDVQRRQYEDVLSTILSEVSRIDARMESGFQTLSRQVASLTLTDMGDGQVLAEGTDLGTGIDALRSFNQKLSHAFRAKSGFKDDDGFMVIEVAEGQDALKQRVRRFRFACFSIKPYICKAGAAARFTERERTKPQHRRVLRLFLNQDVDADATDTNINPALSNYAEKRLSMGQRIDTKLVQAFIREGVSPNILVLGLGGKSLLIAVVDALAKHSFEFTFEEPLDYKVNTNGEETRSTGENDGESWQEGECMVSLGACCCEYAAALVSLVIELFEMGADPLKVDDGGTSTWDRVQKPELANLRWIVESVLEEKCARCGGNQYPGQKHKLRRNKTP